MFEFDLHPSMGMTGNQLRTSPEYTYNHNENVHYNEQHNEHYGGDSETHHIEDNPTDPDICEKKPVSQRLHTQYALHNLTNDEHVTYSSMLQMDEHAEVFPMPTHHMESGNVRGFRLVVDGQQDCMILPITRDIFMGSTCVECDPGDKDIHPDVIRMLSTATSVKENILKMLTKIALNEPSDNVSLSHMPIYGDTDAVAVSVDDNCTGHERSQILLENLIADRIGHHSTTMRGRDSRPWKSDMPKSVGVYHAYVRSRDSGRRHHKLFIIVSGGCRRACEQFYNMNLDLLGKATAHELESCEEAWWLRRTCTRSRCRVVQLVADALELNVPVAGDVFAYEDMATLPIVTTDTLHHDINQTDDGRIAVMNECCDTTRIQNGILFTQYPTEGVHIVKGSHQSAVGTLSNFGGVFGHQERCGAFPTGTFTILEDNYQDQIHPSHYTRSNSATYAKNTPTHMKLCDTRLNLYKEKPSPHVVLFNPVTGEEVKDINWDERPAFVTPVPNPVYTTN